MRTRSLVAALLVTMGAAPLGRAGLPTPQTAAPQTAPPAPTGVTLDAAGEAAAELAAAQRTREALEEKVAEREVVIKKRVRTLYKLTRGGLAPLWIDESERARLVRNRAAARRVILRDLEEQKDLRDELALARDAESRAAARAVKLTTEIDTPLPAGRLARPVAGAIVATFGVYMDPATQARLARRGIDLASTAGATVVTPGPGKVLYAGPVRGLGDAVLIDLGAGVVAVVGGLGSMSVARGAAVAPGQIVGQSLGNRVTLEIRRDGIAVNPAPLLRR